VKDEGIIQTFKRQISSIIFKNVEEILMEQDDEAEVQVQRWVSKDDPSAEWVEKDVI
jgi:hypothetical protein